MLRDGVLDVKDTHTKSPLFETCCKILQESLHPSKSFDRSGCEDENFVIQVKPRFMMALEIRTPDVSMVWLFCGKQTISRASDHRLAAFDKLRVANDNYVLARANEKGENSHT